jgi:sugar O-acyltransferase (sialic acid O-acetyltransferase NeuD family)
MTQQCSNYCGKNDLIIVGAGGHARELAWVANEATLPWRLIGFLDDCVLLQGRDLMGVPVLGPIADWTSYPDAAFVIAIGSPRVRRDVVRRMQLLGTPGYATVIHRSVVRSPHVHIGVGTMVMAGCVLSTQISIGCHAIINQSATVAHDAIIEDFCTIAPNVTLSGNVTLRQGAEVGTSTCVRQGVTIGRGALVGMGSVVTADVADAQLVFGNPARLQRVIDTF